MILPAVVSGFTPRRSRETVTSVVSRIGSPSTRTGAIRCHDVGVVWKAQLDAQRQARMKPMNSEPLSPMKMLAG